LKLFSQFKQSFRALSRFEWGLWIVSVCVVTLSFLLGDTSKPLTLVASLIGVTSLILIAKGDVLGQVLTCIFSILYAIVSFELRYYGEMITYLGMTFPSAAAAIVAWLRHPFEAAKKEGKNEVEVAPLTSRYKVELVLGTVAATVLFRFILRALGNASLFLSTISVSTSFMASYLLIRRNSGYALAYAANDIILIALWIIASMENLINLPMVFCFLMFLFNDFYAFINWRRIQNRQQRFQFDAERK